ARGLCGQPGRGSPGYLWESPIPRTGHVHYFCSYGHHPGATAAWLVREDMRMRRVLPGIGLALGVICLALVVRMLPSYYIGLLTEALILGIFAMSLNLLIGHTGIPSLGHAAYFGAGAYTMALLSLRVIEHWWVGAAAGVMVSVVIAALYGLLALRMSGVYCMMIT